MRSGRPIPQTSRRLDLLLQYLQLVEQFAQAAAVGRLRSFVLRRGYGDWLDLDSRPGFDLAFRYRFFDGYRGERARAGKTHAEDSADQRNGQKKARGKSRALITYRSSNQTLRHVRLPD